MTGTTEIRIDNAPDGWTSALTYCDRGGRMLLTVAPDGTVTLADDLTIDEAKTMLREMAGNVVVMMRQ